MTVSALTSTVEVGAPAQTVELNLLTLLKIMQHARDCGNNVATGQLLGMDVERVVEITDSFPFASNVHEEIEQDEYQLEMMKSLRDINVDHNTVGWYQSCSFDGFITSSLIEAQYNYQSTIFNSVVLIYDHIRSSLGSPVIKALRLKSEFMDLFKDKKSKIFAPFIGMEMFEELSIKIKLSSMESLFLFNQNIPSSAPVQSPEINNLILSSFGEDLITTVDDFLAETGRLQHYLRSTAKQQQALGAQLHRLKNDTAQRSLTGEDSNHISSIISNFRPTPEPSRFSSSIASSNLHVLLDEYIDFAKFPKTVEESKSNSTVSNMEP